MRRRSLRLRVVFLGDCWAAVDDGNVSRDERAAGPAAIREGRCWAAAIERGGGSRSEKLRGGELSAVISHYNMEVNSVYLGVFESGVPIWELPSVHGGYAGKVKTG
jgi:hypothetical protein